MADSNSFLRLGNSSDSSRKQIFRDIFREISCFIMKMYVLCTCQNPLIIPLPNQGCTLLVHCGDAHTPKNHLTEVVHLTYHFIEDKKTIGLDKGGYPVNIFLIPPRKHMLWVCIRSASARRF